MHTKLKIHNNTSRDLKVVVEPWAEEFDVEKSSSVNVDIYSDQVGLCEQIISDDVISVWLWGGCTARVSVDDLEIDRKSLSIPSP